MKNLRLIWITFLIGILIYSLKIPLKNELPVYAIVFPILCLLFLAIMSKRNLTNRYVYKPLKITMYCWLTISIWGFLLSIINGDLSIGVPYLRFDVAFVFVSFVLSYYVLHERYNKYIAYSFFSLGGIIALSGIYEAITGNFYHLTKTSYLYHKNWLGLYKPNTIFYNINDSATFMYIAIIIAFVFADKFKNKKMIQLISIILFGENIVFVESRGVMIGFLIFIVIYMWNRNLKKNKLLNRIMVLILIVSFVVIFLTSGEQLLESTNRINVWKNSLYTFIESFGLGTGPGRTVLLNERNQMYLGSVYAVHNLFLETLCDYGIVGFSAFVYWYVFLIRCAKKQKNMYNSALSIYAGLWGFLPVSISSSSLFGKSFVIVFFALIVAQLNANEKRNIAGKEKERISF